MLVYVVEIQTNKNFCYDVYGVNSVCSTKEQAWKQINETHRAWLRIFMAHVTGWKITKIERTDSEFIVHAQNFFEDLYEIITYKINEMEVL